MKKLELVFIPGLGTGHLPTAVQFANLLLHRNHSLSITFLIIQMPTQTNTAAQLESLSASSSYTPRIRFIALPLVDTVKGFDLKLLVETQKPNVREAVANLTQRPSDSHSLPKLAGFVLDMFCSTLIDVANEFRVPSYIFFSSNAGYLSFTFHLQELYDQESQQFLHSDTEMTIPGFTNPIPTKVVPNIFFKKEIADWLHDNTRRFRQISGILVNTFYELESQVLNSLSENTNTTQFPAVYPVGPILDLIKDRSDESSESKNGAEILKWLDEQPPSSVVFLCFGSRGSFNEDQTREIAKALEASGHRFLWSLRRPSAKGIFESPTDYANVEEVLPEGFLDRTREVGRVMGWAPQREILAHPATGGFVSHCGWNSTLESIWYGVPMGAWPLYAEQHFNAFEMVVELGLAVEISMETKLELKMENKGTVVSAEKIEHGIRKLMMNGNGNGNSSNINGEMRKLVKSKSEESRKSVMEMEGSSFVALNRFIDHVISNCS